MSRSLLLSLLGLAIGLAVGYLLGSADEAPARAGSARSNGANRSAPETRPVQTPPTSPEVASDLSEVLHRLPVPHWETGGGRITGVVRDGSGNGVAGVTIRASQQGLGVKWRKGDAAPELDTLEEAVQKAVKSYYWRRQTTVEAVTDASGAYALEGLADREYGLAAYLEGYEVKAAKGAQVWNVKPGVTIDWTATAVVTVPVDVLLPDGTRPERAWIECRLGNATASQPWSPERREIRVAPGTYSFNVSIGGNQEFRSDAVQATVDAGQPVEPITFRLVGRPGIRGTVRFRTGERFSSLRVFALRFTGAELPTDAQLGAQGKETWIWESNNYEFSFLDVPAGRYRVGVGSRKGSIFAATTVDVGEQITSTEVVVDEIDPKYYVLVRVLGPDGEPAAVDDVSTSYESGNGSSSGGSTWARRANGSYIVFHHDHEMVEGGTYGVELTSKQYGKKTIRYQLGKEREFEVRFLAPATLAVSVRGFGGSAHADKVTLGLRKPTDERRWAGAAEGQAPDGDGRCVLGPVETGDYELVLYVRTDRHGSVPAFAKPIALPAGKSETSVAMPALHELVVNGTKGQQYHIGLPRDSGVWFSQSQRCGDDGRAVFGPLPAGRYTLRKDGSPGEMDVQVPGPVVVFKETEYNALKVSIQDPDGALAKAGFADGDLVVAVNGTEFKGAAQMQIAFAGAMAKGDATLTLVRGGRTLELTVNLQEVMRGANAKPGGSVQPTVR